MKKLLIPILCTFLSGCGVYECVDAKFPRDPKPIDEVFIVELKYQEQDVIKKKIVCEEYYDAMCSERGNFWAEREVGFAKYYQHSDIEVHDSSIGNIIFPMPSCGKLVNKQDILLDHLTLTIDGTDYFYKKSNGKFHTYQTSTPPGGKAKAVTLNFELKVNGVPAK